MADLVGKSQGFSVNFNNGSGNATGPSLSSTSSSSNSSSSNGTPSHNHKKPFLIGVAGGTASGKSTVCERIMDAVVQTTDSEAERRQIISISQDSFYRDLTEKEGAKAAKGLFNFDHPDAFDMELMQACLEDIREGKPTKVPVYDFKKNARVKGEYTIILPSDVVLVEGILVFYSSSIREMFDMKLFVDTDADTRLARRVVRDTEQRGRDLEHVLHQYITLVKPAFEEFCMPTKKFADVIIPRGADNTVAIDLIVQHIKDLLNSPNRGRRRMSPVGSQKPRFKSRHLSLSEQNVRPH